MNAIRVTALTGPDDVELAEVERPSPGPEQVLIEVACAGVTFPELLQTRGLYQTKHELPFVLGSEASGIVAEAGPGSRFSVGDRVAAITGVGTFAEYLVADDASTMADRKSTRLNSSHVAISYAACSLTKKTGYSCQGSANRGSRIDG